MSATMTHDATATTTTPSRNAIAIGIALCALVLGLVVWVAGMLFGLRTFVIETPSMGTAAPVGTLVVAQHVDRISALEPGDIITFSDPANGRDYTHRIVTIGANGGIRTQGDINPEPDVWEIKLSDVVGKAVVVAPVWGTVLRAMPWLLIGGLIVSLLAQYATKTRQGLTATYLVGLPLVFAITSIVLRPYVGAVMLGTNEVENQSRVSFVSTGLLPSKITLRGTDVSSHFGSGEVASLPVIHTDAKGLAMFDLGLDLSWLGWLVFILICLTPCVLGFIYGRRERRLQNEMA